MTNSVTAADYLLLVVSCVACIEILFRSGALQRAAASVDAAQKAARVIGAKGVSDHWKEKAIRSYSFRIFFNSMAVLVLILLAILPFAIAIYVSPPLLPYVLSLVGTCVLLAIAAVYVVLRRRLSGKLQ